MLSINYNERIPNNVDLGENRRLQRALESWLPNYLSWWDELGPEGTQGYDVYLRTAVDVGTDAWWWDYGTLQNWHANVRRLLDDGTEPGGMRQFFGVQRTGDSVVVGGAPIGSWSRSVLVDVDGQIDAHDSVAVATRGPLKLDRALLYAVRTEQALRAEDCVLAEGKGPRMQTSLDRDGGADWEVCLPGNPMSYAEWYRSNPEE